MYAEAVQHVSSEGHLDPDVGAQFARQGTHKCRSTIDLRGATPGTEQHPFKGIPLILQQQQNILLITSSLLWRQAAQGLQCEPASCCALLRCTSKLHMGLSKGGKGVRPGGFWVANSMKWGCGLMVSCSSGTNSCLLSSNSLQQQQPHMLSRNNSNNLTNYVNHNTSNG